MKVVSTQMAFVGGRRYRPGEPFDLPDDTRLAPGMSRVEEGKPVKAAPEVKLGDTKPDAAARAAKAKAGGINDQG